MDRLLLICFVFSQNFMDHLFKAFNTAAALFHKSEFTQFIGVVVIICKIRVNDHRQGRNPI